MMVEKPVRTPGMFTPPPPLTPRIPPSFASGTHRVLIGYLSGTRRVLILLPPWALLNALRPLLRRFWTISGALDEEEEQEEEEEEE